MMRWIVSTSIQSRLMVAAVAVGLIAYGVTQLKKMPVDVLPEFSRPYVEIQTESLGLSAEEVEQLITVPMEQDLLNGVPWLDDIRSESVPGLSSIVLFFEPGADLMRARQLVAERVAQAVALPHVSKPPVMLQPLSATSRVMIVGLSSKTVSHIEMSVLARWTIAPRLMGVPGVANVAVWGQRDWQLQVQVDPKRLAEKNVPLLRVLETAGNALWVSSLSFVEASTPGTGGFIDTANQRLGIRHVSPIVTPEDLAQVPIEGTTLHLSDVANVVEDHQPLIGDALTTDDPGLLLVVEKFPGANTLEVTRGVEEALAELGPGLPGIKIDVNVYRPADFIEAAISNLGLAMIGGIVLVALVLIVFFLEWHATLISLVAIPLSLVAAALVLYVSGATMNMIVLTGFVTAIGVVVYDAIIDVENIVRRLRQYRGEGSTKTTARIIFEASLETRSAIIYVALILLLAVSPIFCIGGVSGSFFQPLAVSYAIAVVTSMVVALTVTPALCLMLLANSPFDRRPSGVVERLQRAYEPLLASLLPHGRLAFVAVAALIAIGLATLPYLGRSMLPSFKELDLLVHMNALPGTSQPEMSRISGRVIRELRSVPGVREVGAHIGRAVRGDQVVNVNSAELWVSIDPAADYAKAAADIQKVVDGYPGLQFYVQTYLRERSSDVVQEPEDEIVVRVYGDTDDKLRSSAEEVKKAIAGINGISELLIKLPLQQATLEAKVDLAAAQRNGLKPGDVRRAAATLLSGIVVGSLYEDQKVFDVVVWSTPETRHSLSSIRNLSIDTPGGGHTRLGDVAEVSIVPSTSVIRHDAVKRYVDVVAEVHGRDLGVVAADITSRLRQVKFPLEYHARVLGEYAAPLAARNRLLIFVAAAAIGVFFLLQAAFRSWRLAALSCLTLPAALVGGLLAAVVTDGSVISLGSLAGLFTVFGIAVCSNIMLFIHYQRLERHEGEAFGPQLVLRGARERLAPILMMTLATGLALVPALVLGDVSGLEIMRPMGMAIVGGLLTSVLLSLFLLPALYLSLGVSSVQELDLFSFADGALDGMSGGVAEALRHGGGLGTHVGQPSNS